LYPAEDTVSGTWKHESGVVGSGSWCFVVDKNQFTDEIEIIGEAGRIVIPTFTHGKVSVFTKNGNTELEFTNPEHIQQNLVKQIVDELRGNGKCVSTGVSAARTSWVLGEMVKGYYLK
jgi:predicted dehydrogenase